jgi:hypothetical protein
MLRLSQIYGFAYFLQQMVVHHARFAKPVNLQAKNLSVFCSQRFGRLKVYKTFVSQD